MSGGASWDLGGASDNVAPTGIGGLDTSQMPPISTASFGKCLPIVYGTNRIPGHIICMPPELWKTVTTSGQGKGGGQGGTGYFQGVWIALAEGASYVTTGRMWVDKDVYQSALTAIDSISTGLVSTPFEFLPGTRPQSPPTDWTAGIVVSTISGSPTTTSVTVSGLAHSTAYLYGRVMFQDGETRQISAMANSGSNDVLTLNTPLTNAPTSGNTCFVGAYLASGSTGIRTLNGSVPAAFPLTLTATYLGSNDTSWLPALPASAGTFFQPGVSSSFSTFAQISPYTRWPASGLIPGPLTALGSTVFTISGISGTNMTVTVAPYGSATLGPGVCVFGPGLTPYTQIVSQSSGVTGSTGVYVVSISQTVGAQVLYGGADYNATNGTYTFAGAIFHGVTSGTNITVSSLSNGAIYIGMQIIGSGVPGNTYITGQSSGLTGSNGVYTTNNSSSAAGNWTGGQVSASLTISYGVNTDLGKYAIGYGGTAALVTTGLTLGASNSMKNISLEFNGLLTGGSAGDVNPALVLVDMITNTQYGMGFNASMLNATIGPDGTAASGLQTYCTQAGILISPVFEDQKSALEHIDWILDASNAECVWSQGRLNIYPVGDVNVGSYTAYITAQYSLNEDNMLASDGEDMIDCTRISPQRTFNCMPVEFVDSQTPDQNSQYQVSVVQDFEQPDVDASGGIVRKGSTKSLKCITKQSIAQIRSRMMAQRSVYVRNSYKFKLPQQFCLLEPFDLVQISDATIGLVNQVVRLLTIEESPDGSFEVEAEDAAIGRASSVAFGTGTAQGGGHILNWPPLNPVSFGNGPIIWTPPVSAAGGGNGFVGVGTGGWHPPSTAFPPTRPVGKLAQLPEVWIGAASPGVNYGGHAVHISYDGTNYAYQGDFGAATMGQTTAAYAAGAPLDTTNTLTTDLSHSGKTISSVTAADRDAFASMALINTGTAGELISYQASTLSGGMYNLTNNRRGLYGTPVGSHPAGVPFCVVDSNIARIPIDTSRFPKSGTSTIYIKIAAYNLAKTQCQSLSSIQPITYTLPNSGSQGNNVLPISDNAALRISFDNYDATQWDFPAGTGTVTLVNSPITGGLALQATGTLMMVSKTLIPYYSNKTYKIECEIAESVGAASCTHYAGFVAVKSDGVTQLDINGSSANPGVPSLQHGASFVVPSAPGVEALSAYFAGYNATGAMPGSLVPSAPSNAVNHISYMRPFIALNYTQPTNVAQVAYISISELPGALDSSHNSIGETPTGPTTTTNANDTYTAANNISSGTEMVFVAGILQPRSNYTISGAKIIFGGTSIPQGEPVTVTYAF